MFKKSFNILVVFTLTIMLMNVFSSSASAADNATATFTTKYANGVSKYYYVEQKNGAILKLYAYFNVSEKGITITSASPKTEDVLWPISVKPGKPKIVTASTNGTSQTAKAYCDFTSYIWKAWKLGSVYESTSRLTINLKVIKIDKAKKTVTYTVSGSSN